MACLASLDFFRLKMYFRIGKHFFESTEIRNGRTSRTVLTQFKKVNWTTQTGPYVGTFLKDSLGRFGGKRTALKTFLRKELVLQPLKPGLNDYR